MKQGNLRNCTKLSEQFLGFYETGKFKELYKIEELIIGKRGARFARIRFI
jgi:hypothetical protein